MRTRSGKYGSCDTTTTLSLVTARSISIASAPTAIAYSNAGMVFSGSSARAPRWPWTAGLNPLFSILGSPQLALAAVAATQALLAAMVGTGVLGAVNADLGGRLAADTAGEGRGLSHSVSALGLARPCSSWPRARAWRAPAGSAQFGSAAPPGPRS